MVLRRIRRRLRESGQRVVELHCGHVVPGEPESRFSRFFPCPPCEAYVAALRAAGAEKNPALVLSPTAGRRKRS
jgi:hypothetical protein